MPTPSFYIREEPCALLDVFLCFSCERMESNSSTYWWMEAAVTIIRGVAELQSTSDSTSLPEITMQDLPRLS